MIPHSKTVLSKNDISSVLSTLYLGEISDNNKRKQFEKFMCKYVGSKYSVATSSGTLAIQLALSLLKIGRFYGTLDDEVLIPTYVCDDVLSAIHQIGAKAIPVDIDATTFNIDPLDAQRRITKKTKAILLIHIFGLPNNMDNFSNLHIPIIEDCAHSLGATWNNQKVGTFGTISTFSFHGLKMLACGKGGVLMTNDDTLIQSHKTMLNPDFSSGGYRLGYHLSDILATLGISQLRSFPKTLSQRQQMGKRYSEQLQNIKSISLPTLQTKNQISSCFRYVIKHHTLQFSKLENLFANQGIIRKPVKNLIHRLLKLKDGEYPVASSLFEHLFSIPFYPALTDKEEETILQKAKTILN